MENYGRDRQATGGNIMRGMRITCWINKSTDTHYSYFLMLIHATLVTWTRLSVTFYVYFPCCYLLSYDSIEFHCHPSGSSEDAECKARARCDLWNTSLSAATHCPLTMQWRQSEDFVNDHMPCWNESRRWLQSTFALSKYVKDRPRLVSHLLSGGSWLSWARYEQLRKF